MMPSDPAIDPILVLGTGALAKLFAYRLAVAAAERTAGAKVGIVRVAGGSGGSERVAIERVAVARPPVTLAGDWPAALSAMAAGGIQLEEADDSLGRAAVAVLSRAELARRLAAAGATASAAGGVTGLDLPAGGAIRADADLHFALVLVLVKSRQTASVAPLAAAALAPGGRILSLQNGLGNRELLCAAAPDPERVLAGVTALGATGLGPGRVRAVGRGETLLGPSSGPGLDAETIAAAFRAAGLPCRVAPDLEALLWRKLAVSAAINPLTALSGRPNGAILEDPGLRALALAAAREVALTAAAEGLDLGGDPGDWVLAVAERTAANRSSMLQDLDRGAPTEIDAICGQLVARARRHGLDLPLCRWLLEAVQALEAGGRREDLVWPRLAAGTNGTVAMEASLGPETWVAPIAPEGGR